MNPQQFQKQIRLQEARRLILGEDLDAAGTGQRAGYEDPAYFSRDYKRLFGAPPQRAIARMRGSLEPGGAPARIRGHRKMLSGLRLESFIFNNNPQR